MTNKIISGHVWNEKENLCQNLEVKKSQRFNVFDRFDCSFKLVKQPSSR